MAMRSGAISRRRLLASASSLRARRRCSERPTRVFAVAADRPHITHGIQSGDVSVDGAVIWARVAELARMRVEARDHRQFSRDHPYPASVDAPSESDSTAKARSDAAGGRGTSSTGRPVRVSVRAPNWRPAGRLLPARAGCRSRRSLRLVGRHPAAGPGGSRYGARRHAQLRDHAAQPAGFLHPSRGDNIYAECPLGARGAELPERRNLAQHRHRGEAPRVAETLADFRWKPPTCSTPICAPPNSEVPSFAQGDDHEADQ